MKKNLPGLRRAHKAEYPLIKNTAKELARRFETQSNWIEVVLFNTICSVRDLRDCLKEHKDISNEILSDDDLDRLFYPSLISALSCLGAKKAKMSFGVSSTEFYEDNISGDDVSKLDDRQLNKEEAKTIHNLMQDVLKFAGAFNILPPPILNFDKDKADGELLDANIILDTLDEFKKHLLKHEDHFLFGGARDSIPAFDTYPWFDYAFMTLAKVPMVVFERGQLSERGKNEVRFFRDENERRMSEEGDLLSLVFKREEYNPPKNYSPYVWIDVGKDLLNQKFIDSVKDKDILLRKKLFGARLFLLDEFQRFFTEDTVVEPYVAMIEYLKNEFSISEYMAIAGDNSEFFGFKAGTRYTYHVGTSMLQHLLHTSLIIPFAFENKIASQFYKAALPIYEFSQEVEGAHLLSFKYFEAYSLISSHIKFQIICNSLEGFRKRHSAAAKRALVDLDSFFSLKRSLKTKASPEMPVDSFAGEFSDDYSSYKPANKKIKPLTFTPMQAEVFKILMDRQDRKASVSQLIKELYSPSEAKEKLDKMAKAKGMKTKKRNEYKYEWRLEKGILKSKHPAWKIGMIKIGKKKGSEKWYYLDFSFEKTK